VRHIAFELLVADAAGEVSTAFRLANGHDCMCEISNKNGAKGLVYADIR
jgi:hypothetical protein